MLCCAMRRSSFAECGNSGVFSKTSRLAGKAIEASLMLHCVRSACSGRDPSCQNASNRSAAASVPRHIFIYFQQFFFSFFVFHSRPSILFISLLECASSVSTNFSRNVTIAGRNVKFDCGSCTHLTSRIRIPPTNANIPIKGTIEEMLDAVSTTELILFILTVMSYDLNFFFPIFFFSTFL